MFDKELWLFEHRYIAKNPDSFFERFKCEVGKDND